MKIRKDLEITRDKQLKFSDERDVSNWWQSAIEKSGVLVFQINDVDIHEVRGFSISDLPLPAIAINSNVGEKIYE